MVTRYIGQCPVCEGDYRLHKMRMVHHGYKRPGHGSIEGDCPGVGYPPYELSTEGTEAYLGQVESSIVLNQKRLEHYSSGTVTSITVTNWRSIRELTPADGYDFTSAIQDKIRDLNYVLKGLDRERVRCERLIDTWVERPVRTEEENMAQKAQISDMRRSEREAARAVRQAKVDATRAKQDAREERYQDFLELYRRELSDLAQRRATKAEALKVWARMYRDSKKAVSSRYRFLDQFLQHLKIDGALIDLGLAEVKRDHLYYADDRGWIR